MSTTVAERRSDPFASAEGTVAVLTGMEMLAPGVRGYAVDAGERGLYVPFVMAEQEGNGDVGRYLINVRLAAIRSFYDFARRMGLLAANPIDDVVRPKTRDPVPHGLAPLEVRQLLDVIPDTRAGRRDRAAIITILLTGLRRAELFSLVAGDLEGSGGQWTYTVRVKGGRTRRRELPGAAATAIAAAHGITDLHDLDPTQRLFPCTAQAFYANLARYARVAGLGHVAPHALRHTAAKLRRDTGESIESVSAFLGHRNLATTARYLQRLEGESDPGWRRVADLVGLGADERPQTGGVR